VVDFAKRGADWLADGVVNPFGIPGDCLDGAGRKRRDAEEFW